MGKRVSMWCQTRLGSERLTLTSLEVGPALWPAWSRDGSYAIFFDQRKTREESVHVQTCDKLRTLLQRKIDPREDLVKFVLHWDFVLIARHESTVST